MSMIPLFGYHMPSFSFPGLPPERLFDRVVELAQAAESAGFDLVTVMDHFYQIAIVAPETEPMLEAYATLAALAQVTSRVRLGTLVSGVTYRNPALLAKSVTTLDTISRGRAVLGIGAAWNDAEHVGYGYEFPPIGERMDRLGEALAIARRMFTEERPSYSGRYCGVGMAPQSRTITNCSFLQSVGMPKWLILRRRTRRPRRKAAPREKEVETIQYHEGHED